MRERPILFSAPMVRALLEGRKTQTRRACRGQRERSCVHDFRLDCCPYGQPGDRLWVRESLTHITCDPVTADPCSVHCYTASIPPGMDSANPYEPNYLFPDDEEPNLPPKNIPAIFMPRWASRILLEVTDVRVQRVQDIGERDAIAEGIPDPATAEEAPASDDARNDFRDLWDSINAKRGFGWEANPWVWAITFRRIEDNAQ